MSQNTSHAVMAQRREPPDSLDFFPTPPWATRALCQHVLPPLVTHDWSVWEPACGEGHMAYALEPLFKETYASDIFDYGRGYDVADFLDVAAPPHCVDWIITNPPFNAAMDFTLRALKVARVGVAMLVRTQWIESEERYENLFRPHPPTVFAPFCERVAIHKGGWDPKGSTATSYAWFVWWIDADPKPMMVIPPGCKKRLTRKDDAKRFGRKTAAPLLEHA